MIEDYSGDYDDVQRELADAIHHYAERAGVSGGADRTWRDLIGMGLPGLLAPEEFGGADLDAGSLFAVANSLGRQRLVTPFIASSILCTRLLARLGTPAQKARWLPDLVSGARVMAAAVSLEPARVHPLHAVLDGKNWVLTGSLPVVAHGGDANCWLVSAAIEPGASGLFLLDGAEPGLAVTPCPAIDGSRAAALTLSGARLAESARVGAHLPQAGAIVDHAIDTAVAGLCAESVGLQETLLSTTLAYVKTRRQFGAAIGSFQVVKHRLVDMLTALEQTRALTWSAIRHLDDADPGTRMRHVSSARVLGARTAEFIGFQSMHLHGGMGMTDELDVGHYVKRLMAVGQMLGNARAHAGRLARLGHA